MQPNLAATITRIFNPLTTKQTSMEQKKNAETFSSEELSEQVRILRRMIERNEEAMEGKEPEEVDEPEVVFSLKDVKTLCEMVLAALGKDAKGSGDEPATIKGQRMPRRRHREGHNVVVSSREKSKEIAKRLIGVVNEYDDYADAANVLKAVIVVMCAVAGQIKEDSHGVRLGLEGKFDIMEPVLLESLRKEGEAYGLNFDEWLNLD